MDNIKLPTKKLISLAKKYELKELALFGSVLTEKFTEESDIDVLIEFKPEAKVSLYDLIDIKDELEQLLNRKVDVVEKSGLRNPFRKKSILGKRKVLYAAA